MAFVGTISPALVTSGTTWTQFSGPGGGLGGILEKLISQQVATTTPSAPTLSATSNVASTLPSGTYWVVVTETNALGETLPSPQAGGQAVTLNTTQLTVTFASLKTGNTARNVYVGTTTGGPYVLAASGITASSVNISAPLPANSYAVNPPTAATTAPTFTNASGVGIAKPMELIRGAERGNLQQVWDYARQDVVNFLAGKPVSFSEAMTKLYHARAALLMLVQAINEAGTLMDANPGTITNSTDPIGVAKKVRTWP